MRVIHKYTVPPGCSAYKFHRGAVILTIQVVQHGEVVMWALIDDSKPTMTREFLLVGTGQPMPTDTLDYIGTVQLEGGALILHLFEVMP